MGKVKRYRVYGEFLAREEKEDIIATSKKKAKQQFIDEMSYTYDSKATNIVVTVEEVLGPIKKRKKK